MSFVSIFRLCSVSICSQFSLLLNYVSRLVAVVSYLTDIYTFLPRNTWADWWLWITSIGFLMFQLTNLFVTTPREPMNDFVWVSSSRVVNQHVLKRLINSSVFKKLTWSDIRSDVDECRNRSVFSPCGVTSADLFWSSSGEACRCRAHVDPSEGPTGWSTIQKANSERELEEVEGLCWLSWAGSSRD